MRKFSGSFLVVFAMVLGGFLTSACQSPNLLWCTSSGILNYNKHTGQFEMVWENQAKQIVVVHDTIYQCPDTLNTAQ